MTEPPDFDIQIAVSADLDGELARYAAELDSDEVTLRQRIAADPRADETRAALATARAELAASDEPLDELTRARMIAAAMTERPSAAAGAPARDRSWMVRAAVAATIVIVAIGGMAALIFNRGNDNAQKSASTSGVRSGDVGDIGNIDEKKLGELIGGSPGSAPAPEATQSGAASKSQAAVAPDADTSRDSTVNGFDSDSPSGASPEQVTKCEHAPPVKGPIRFSGSGAYQGRPAVILGISKGDRTIVFVVAADDCAEVLFSVSR